MNEADIVRENAEKLGMTRASCKECFESFVESMRKAILAGDPVKIQNFGTLMPVERAPRTGRNPKNGKPLKIKGSWNIKFSASKAFRNELNGK